MAKDAIPDGRWKKYIQATTNRKPRPLLLDALSRFGEFKGFAIDLGCGAGVDAAEILRQGWKLLAIDQQPEALELLRQRTPPSLLGNLTGQVATFDQVQLPQADLIWSSMSLPFCPPEYFPRLWTDILHALKPGGLFAGDLFGERSFWAREKGITILTEERVKAMLAELQIELYEVEDRERQVATQGVQWVHIFSIIARKPEWNMNEKKLLFFDLRPLIL